MLLQVQRQRGNRYVQELVGHARAAVPAPAAPGGPLVVGPAGDEHEREADRVAAQMMRLPAQPDRNRARDAAGVLPGQPRGPRTVQGPGRALQAGVRAGFEAALGADFGRVRIHAGDEAARLSRSLGAEAFTRGPDVYFGAGRYAPETAPGRRLLAHELTHVIQQGSAAPGRSRPPGAGGGAPAGRRSAGAAAPGGSAALVQRKMSWQNTNWAEATRAWASPGGAVGVLFVTDAAADDPVVVKTGEPASAEVLLAANLHRVAAAGSDDWAVVAPGVRIVAPDEGAQIRDSVRPLVGADERALGIVNHAAEPGTVVFEYAPGKDFQKLLGDTPKHSEETKGPRRQRTRVLRAVSPLRFFEDRGFMQSLGMLTAIDIFTGNFDRLTTFWNPENFKIDQRTILLIDNVYFSDAFAFKTFRNEHVELTSGQAYEAWAQNAWPQRLQRGEFDSIADNMLTGIREAVVAVVREVDQPAVRQALRAKEWLAEGLAEGASVLRNIYLHPPEAELTQGLAPADQAEVMESVRRRLAYLFAPPPP